MTTTARCKHCSAEIERWGDTNKWHNWSGFIVGDAVYCKGSGHRHEPEIKEDLFDLLYNRMTNEV